MSAGRKWANLIGNALKYSGKGPERGSEPMTVANGVEILLVEDDPADVEMTLRALRQNKSVASARIERFKRDGELTSWTASRCFVGGSRSRA